LPDNSAMIHALLFPIICASSSCFSTKVQKMQFLRHSESNNTVFKEIITASADFKDSVHLYRVFFVSMHYLWIFKTIASRKVVKFKEVYKASTELR
jgi:hypothetical protein